VNFLADTWYLFAVALVSGGLLLWPSLRRGAPAGGVGTAEAVQLINRERAVLIDVREPAEFAAGHLPNAKNIPLATLEASTQLPKNKALPIVVVCNRGAHGSRAVVMLRKMGHENARTLSGGLAAWREANLPVEKAG
jgi:rhodanese-related sulfurtransferase